MNKISRDDAFDIADSTDWLQTPLHSLAAVDSALRCQVCKDFYTTPMITSCSHTFCSLCIRRCLNNDGKCPACRTQDQELKLRFNGAMQDLVEAFVNARPEVLEHARRPIDVPRSPSAKRDRDQAELEDVDAPRKRTRSAGTRTASRRSQPTPSQVVQDSDDDDEDFIPEDGYVICPVCSKQVKETSINSHLDRDCADEPLMTKSKPMGRMSRQGSAQNPLTISDSSKAPERLAQINFSMMKEAALRKKLGEMGISATGNKPLMERRYTEWITLWNANCDARKPRTKAELKRELEVWERSQGGRAQTSTYVHGSGAQVKDKDFDGKAYSNAHDDSFRKLIENARKKAVTKPSTIEAPNSSNQPLESPYITEPEDATKDVVGPDDQAQLVNYSGSQLRSFEKGTQIAESQSRPSSQLPSNLKVMDRDPGVAPDLPAIGTVQP